MPSLTQQYFGRVALCRLMLSLSVIYPWKLCSICLDVKHHLLNLLNIPQYQKASTQKPKTVHFETALPPDDSNIDSWLDVVKSTSVCMKTISQSFEKHAFRNRFIGIVEVTSCKMCIFSLGAHVDLLSPRRGFTAYGDLYRSLSMHEVPIGT